MNRDTSRRGRGPATVTAAEKAQAHEVSLRRIGRLFRPYRWQLAVVTAIIAASSLVGLASPFLLRAVIDTALPDKNLRHKLSESQEAMVLSPSATVSSETSLVLPNGIRAFRKAA
jgi:ABC-type multidrug transport system fused ATPase/permease subunit